MSQDKSKSKPFPSAPDKAPPRPEPHAPTEPKVEQRPEPQNPAGVGGPNPPPDTSFG